MEQLTANNSNLRSFIEVAADSDFPIQNLPFGIFSATSNSQPHMGVAIGEFVLDLAALSAAGLFVEIPFVKQGFFQQNSLNPLLAQGRSDLFFRLEVLKKILIIVSIVITYRWGVAALISGQIVVSCLGFFLNSYYTGKFIGYSSIAQIRDVMPSAVLASIMGICVYFLSVIPFPNPLITMVVQVIFGIGLYFVLCRLFRLESFMDVVALARPKIATLLQKS